MKVTLEDTRHIAKLARLHFSEGELEVLQGQMSELLTYFSTISQLELEGVPPTTSVLPLANVLREDTVHPGLTREEALANAPEAQNGFFRIPAILEGE